MPYRDVPLLTFEANRPRVVNQTNEASFGLDFLEELLKIDSQTKNIAGVNQVQELLALKLSEMGFHCRSMANSEAETGNLLYAIKKGISSEQVSFIGHADTVCSPSMDFQFKINYAAQTLSGPGIGDDKGSLVMALESLKTFFETHPNHFYTYVFVSSPSEESGSIGFHSIFKEIGANSKIVLGLEPALFNGSLISSRNGNRWYNIKIKGRASHAGRFGEPFINAAHHAAEFIAGIHSLNDIENKIKVNVGSISGGMDRYNVICDTVEIKLDARFPCIESRDRIDQAIRGLIDSSSVKCFYTDEKCESTIEVVDDCPPLPLTNELPEFLKQYAAVVSQIEKEECSLEHSGGAADINYFARPGLIYLDGVGPKTKGMHTKNEVMDLRSFYSRQYALTKMLSYIEGENNER